MTLPTRSEAPATAYAVALFTELVRLGVRDVVLSPGSRSQALALAAAAFEDAGLIRLRVRIDERVAGFVALGLAVETGAPVVVITTSGTAVANLHPAVLEAHHAGVPLVVITADRPEEMLRHRQQPDHPAGRHLRPRGAPRLGRARPDRGSGRGGCRRRARPRGRRRGSRVRRSSAGPVHVNLAFREPLSSAVDPGRLSCAGAPATPSADPRSGSSDRARATPRLETTILQPAPRTVVVAGQSAGGAGRGGCPPAGRAAHRRGREWGPLRPEPRRRLPRAAARPRLRRPGRTGHRVRASDAQPGGSRAHPAGGRADHRGPFARCRRLQPRAPGRTLRRRHHRRG